MRILPFLPLPEEKAIKISREKFGWFGRAMVKLFPALQKNLAQARFQISDKDYLSLTFFSSLFMLFFLFSTVFLLFIILGEEFQASLNYAITFGVIASLSAFIYALMRPKIRSGVRKQMIERDLPFALRHILLKIRSGSTLYEAISSVAKADYGIVSQEFREVVSEVKTGISFKDSLKNLAVRTSSDVLRVVLWQLINAVETGANLEEIIRQIVNSTTEFQKAQISGYVNELNFWTMMYMALAVIGPSLGAAFIIFATALLGLELPSYTVFLLLFLIVFFEYSFIKFVKSRRTMVYI